MTAHELARVLLALPDVIVLGQQCYSEGFFEIVKADIDDDNTIWLETADEHPEGYYETQE